MPDTRRIEPWPWIVVSLLVAMISGSLAFFAIAVRHPDPPVVEDGYRAGLEYVERLTPPGLPEASGDRDD